MNLFTYGLSEPLENVRLSRIFSRTFSDLKLQFPGLSRTKVIFRGFPGPGILEKKNPGLSRRRGNPEMKSSEDERHSVSSCAVVSHTSG